MTFKIEMKNLMNFFARRKWILLLTTVITAIVFAGVMHFSSTTKDEPTNTEEKAKVDQYYSYFTFIAENPINGNNMMSISTMKSALTTERNLKELNEAGFTLDQKDLNYTMNLFTNGESGETIYLIIRNTSEENVKTAINYYYNLLVNKNSEYFSQKNMYYLSQPSDPSLELPVKAYYTSTDNNLFEAATASKKPIVKKDSQLTTNILYGIGIGLILGFILAFVRDTTDKKIHGTSYIYPLFKDQPMELIDLTFENNQVSSKKINMLLNADSERDLVISETESTWINTIKETAQADIAIKEVSPLSIKAIDQVYILVQKHLTTSKWLHEQIVLLSDTTIPVSIIFVDK
ncbi:YveK family protein [Isobaculum melis]|uniref:Uncharacterized protein n=1 Tax=Isobaculum melis TaxID=142588 RepID=A0A1H9QRP3_9LACT|nr:hypothetical protein [Isobaculum melis]SER62403.1 hypothetical protein SAMN04488559_102206 [Isobaculum melis]